MLLPIYFGEHFSFHSAQGLSNYPLTSMTVNEADVFFDMSIQGQPITFDVQVEQDKITGTFTQQGQSFPFELTKGSKEQLDEKGLIDGITVFLKDELLSEK